MPSLAITDHGNMFGAIEFYKKARKAGIRPIIGAELYMTTGPMTEKNPERYHIVCLARNMTGYHNLIKLVSAGYIRGFYGKPRTTIVLVLGMWQKEKRYNGWHWRQLKDPDFKSAGVGVASLGSRKAQLVLNFYGQVVN